MHILELPSFFPPYGGLFCVDQSKALAMQGNEVRIAANVNLSARLSTKMYLTSPIAPYTTSVQGIEVLRRDMRGIPFFLKARVRCWLNAALDLVDKYVEKYGKPDIIHAHCCMWAGVAAMRAARKYSIPYVITEHLPYAIQSEAFRAAGAAAWQIPMLKEAYRKAALVIPVSEELVDDIAPLVGKDYDWKFVSNTIDVDFFSYRKRNGMRNGLITMCCVADNVPRKGYDILLPAFRLFLDKYKAKAKLIVAGSGTDSENMREMVRKYDLEGNTEILGKVDRNGVLAALYRSDCFVFATRSEVQPLVVLEAMSTGIPVASTEAIPRSERIEGACFISPIDDIEGLAENMHKISGLTDFDGEKISVAIRNLASPEVVGKKLDALFKSACESFCANE